MPASDTNRKAAQQRIAQLRAEINRHRYLYHVLDRPEISDAANDSLKHELAELEHAYPDLITPDSPTQRVGGAPLPGFKKVRHQRRMLSLNDAFSAEELAEWETRIRKLAPDDPIEYFAEAKIDGFAISLEYEDGILVTGSTRGNGTLGEDVTKNLQTIESIPLRLGIGTHLDAPRRIQKLLDEFPAVRAVAKRIPQRLEIRGEVYMTKAAFAAVNREQAARGLPLYANPRNIAAGSIRQLDPKAAASRKLDFLAYGIPSRIGQDTHEEEHAIAMYLGFKTISHSRRCPTLADVIAFWKDIGAERDRLPFLIDGIVVQVNATTHFERLGVAGKAPRGAIAFKYPAIEATTVVEDIIVQVGRTGVLTPVAILKPVQVSGVTVSRATLHNMDEIARLDVRPGDTVIIRRAGDVIPDIVRVLPNLRPKHAKSFRMPSVFCDQPVVRPDGAVAHRIRHPERCALVQRERLYHFVSKSAVDIPGLGPKIIDQLADAGLIQDAADLFGLTAGDLAGLEHFQEVSSQKLVRAIQSRKTIPLARFIIALGIPHVGEETAIDLAKRFGTLEKLERATADDLVHIPNIGSVVGESIARWFQTFANQRFVKKLRTAGLRIHREHTTASAGPMEGKTFVFTGTLEGISRDDAKRFARALGAHIAESVSKKTDYLVAGADPGTKKTRAETLGVTILDEAGFRRLIG